MALDLSFLSHRSVVFKCKWRKSIPRYRPEASHEIYHIEKSCEMFISTMNIPLKEQYHSHSRGEREEWAIPSPVGQESETNQSRQQI